MARAHALRRPVEITKYTATQEFELDRNPAWNPASDPLRNAYVDDIDVTEGISQANVQQQIEAGTGDMDRDVTPPPAGPAGVGGAKDDPAGDRADRARTTSRCRRTWR